MTFSETVNISTLAVNEILLLNSDDDFNTTEQFYLSLDSDSVSRD